MKIKNKQNFRYGSFSVIITVLVIIAIFALNVLATYVESNNGLRVDFTPTESYTLDKNAESALKDLNKDVVIYTFIPNGTASEYSAYTQNIAAMFDGASDKVTYMNVDPVVNPSKLQQFSSDTKKLEAYSVVICEKGNESNYHAYNEQEDLIESKNGVQYFVLQKWITSALVYIRTGIKPNVYVLSGHGEDLESDEAIVMMKRIRRENFNVEIIDLTSGQKTLQQGDILVVPEPTSDMSKAEYDQIISFLDKDYGRMLFMASKLKDDSGEQLKNYTNLLEYFNITLSDSVIAETNADNRTAQSAKDIKLVADQSHEISYSIRVSQEPVRAFETSSYAYKYEDNKLTTGTHTETFSSILTSYASSISVPWSDAVEFDENNYKKGISTVASAYERVNTVISGTTATTTTRILLFGSESIATGEYLGNANVLRNGMNWLAGREASDTIVNLGINLTPSYVRLSQLQMQIWFTVLVIVVPAGLFIAGVVVWIRRKNR